MSKHWSSSISLVPVSIAPFFFLLFLLVVHNDVSHNSLFFQKRCIRAHTDLLSNRRLSLLLWTTIWIHLEKRSLWLLILKATRKSQFWAGLRGSTTQLWTLPTGRGAGGFLGLHGCRVAIHGRTPCQKPHGT